MTRFIKNNKNQKDVIVIIMENKYVIKFLSILACINHFSYATVYSIDLYNSVNGERFLSVGSMELTPLTLDGLKAGDKDTFFQLAQRIPLMPMYLGDEYAYVSDRSLFKFLPGAQMNEQNLQIPIVKIGTVG